MSLVATIHIYTQILSFNEISRLNGLDGLHRLQHLDLGYNVIEGVQRYRSTSPPTPDPGGGGGGDGGGGSSVHPRKNASPVTDKDPPNPSVRSHGKISACDRSTAQDEEVGEAAAVAAAGIGRRGGAEDEGGGGYRHSSVASVEINLPALTRLDLNNNILHDLDDLKVSAHKVLMVGKI